MKKHSQTNGFLVSILLILSCVICRGQEVRFCNLRYSEDVIGKCTGVNTYLGKWCAGQLLNLLWRKDLPFQTNCYLELDNKNEHLGLCQIDIFAEETEYHDGVTGYYYTWQPSPCALALITDNGTHLFSLMFYYKYNRPSFSHETDLFEPYRLFKHILAVLEDEGFDECIQKEVLFVVLMDIIGRNRWGLGDGYQESPGYSNIDLERVEEEWRIFEYYKNEYIPIRQPKLYEQFSKHVALMEEITHREVSVSEWIDDLYIYSDTTSLDSKSRREHDRDTLLCLYFYLLGIPA